MPFKETFSSPVLTTGGVARIFGVHPCTVRRWCEQGLLNFHRSGPRGRRYFSKADVAAAYLDKSIQKYLQDYSTSI